VTIKTGPIVSADGGCSGVNTKAVQDIRAKSKPLYGHLRCKEAVEKIANLSVPVCVSLKNIIFSGREGGSFNTFVLSP